MNELIYTLIEYLLGYCVGTDSLEWPQLKLVGYTGYKFVNCSVNLDRTHRQGPSY